MVKGKLEIWIPCACGDRLNEMCEIMAVMMRAGVFPADFAFEWENVDGGDWKVSMCSKSEVQSKAPADNP